MEKEIRKKLIELATLKTTMSYSILNEQLYLGLDFSRRYDIDQIGEWLENISLNECSKGRPLLSSLIVYKDKKKKQGDGFYKMLSRILENEKVNPESHRRWKNIKFSTNWGKTEKK